MVKWFGKWRWNRLGNFLSCLYSKARWTLSAPLRWARERLWFLKFMLVNRHRGEVAAVINGRPRKLRLTLAALAQLEDAYDGTDVLQLMRRFSSDGLKAQDVICLLRAGLAGAGDALAQSDTELEVRGGYAAAVALATRLLEAGFGEEPQASVSAAS